MKSKIYSSTDDLNAILPQVEELYQKCKNPNPYFSSLWVSIWWKHFGKETKPRLLTVWDKSETRILGFWPLYEVKVVSGKALWPMLYNVADYFDPLIDVRELSNVSDQLIELFLKETRRYSYIWTLVVREEFYTLLKPHAEKKKNKQLLNQSKQRFYVDLKDKTYDALIEDKLGTKSRKTLRYTERKLNEGDTVEFIDLNTSSDIEEYLPTLCEVELASWKSSEGIGIFAMPGLRAFFFELLPLLGEKSKSGFLF